MQTILDTRLLKATDTTAKPQKMSRSAFIRQALREHLKRLHILQLGERERRGYQAQPQRIEEYRPWEEAAVWPQD